MTDVLTHVEICGDKPDGLAEFDPSVFGWQVEQIEAVDDWRVNTGSGETNELNGGLTYRAIPGLNGWMLYVQVPLLDETVELIKQFGRLGYSPKDCRPQGCYVETLAARIYDFWSCSRALLSGCLVN